MNKLIARKILLVMMALVFLMGFSTLSMLPVAADEAPVIYDYEVDHIYQYDYDVIGDCACGPTSLTMLLRYYFPHSGIDVPEVYSSGIQDFTFHGAAVDYEAACAGMYPDAAAHYLNAIWGGQAESTDADLAGVINELEDGPVILNVWHFWTEGGEEKKGGHYVVLTGYNNNNTADYEDDAFYVNDPAISLPTSWDYDEFQRRRDGKSRIIAFKPILSEEQREYTLVVDNDHAELDDVNAKDADENYVWQRYYGPASSPARGDWYYPEEGGHWAKWVPNLAEDGNYEIHVIFRKDNEQSDVTYTIYAADDTPLGQKVVNQHAATPYWTDENLGSFRVTQGAYVKVKNVPAGCNVDAVRFEYVIKGVDVSHHQNDRGAIDWKEVKNAGYEFAFVKATGATSYTDPYFTANMKDAKAAGLLVGAYHFAYPEYNDAVSEANHFVNIAGDYLKAGYLRPVLDLEEDPTNDSHPHRMGKENLSNWIHLWMDTVKNETGVEPILYTGWYARQGDYLNASIAEYDLWIAHYTERKAPPDIGIWDTWDFWQYSEEGSVPGIQGDVDLNLFKGSLADLQEYRIDMGGAGPVDVALIIDDSGSMSWNDPSYMRRQAAEVFISAMQNNDQIGIVAFTGSARLLWEMQSVGADRQLIIHSLNSLWSSGGTSLSAGLSAGYQQLLSVESSGNKKAAVFLTDGVGSYNNEAQMFADKGWPIYVLGLGYDLDETLLQKIADDSGGVYIHLTDPNELRAIYHEIATEIAGGEMILIEQYLMNQGDFIQRVVRIAEGTFWAIFGVFWDGSTVDLTLIAPDGTLIDPSTVSPNVYHAKGLTYELYRITNPLPGEWTIIIHGSDLPAGGEDVTLQVSVVGPPMSPSTYKFEYSVPDPIVVDTDVSANVTFMTDEEGDVGYDGVRFKFEAGGPGAVTFAATDSEDVEHTFSDSGYWGPESGFDLPAVYVATTAWTLNFGRPGNYTITFSLIEAPDGEVIADITETVHVTVRPVEAIVTVDPETLDLKARGKWITAYIELPEKYAVEDIDIGTVQLLYDGNQLDADWGDVQDGVLMVKFDRATVAGWFEDLHDEEVELTVAGEVNGIQFEGTDTIRVIDPPRPRRGT